MFEQDSFQHFFNHEKINIRTQTNQKRQQRIKKNKNIRKQKVSERKKLILQSEFSSNSNLTNQQRKYMQKQKNRIAAQNSRDRHKKHLDYLQEKIKQMEKTIQSQICRRCKTILSQHSTSEGQPHQQSHTNIIGHLDNQSNRNQINLFNQQSNVQPIPWVREPQMDVQWGNIGKYLCIFLFVLAFALFTNSIETAQGTSKPLIPRILTQNNNLCQNPNICFPQNRYQKNWPFKSGTGEPLEQCKNNFWQHYLEKAKTQVAFPYDQNLLTCNNPNLVHIQTVYEKSAQVKWTFLITNPRVTNVLIRDTGQHELKDVNYLEGVYQLMAQRVVLTKVMGENCLT